MGFTAVFRALGLAAVVAGCAVSPAWADGPKGQDDSEYASLPVMQVGRAELPAVLSAEDEALYRRIFALQDKGDIATADKLTAKLGDRVLMGHVLAQRYLHPNAYRSKYKELKDWMDAYADHYQAPAIYKLALARRPANAAYPAKPAKGEELSEVRPRDLSGTPARKKLTRAEFSRVSRLKATLKTHLRRGNTKDAKQMLDSPEVKGLFDALSTDWAYERLARGYFMDGRDDLAVEWAERAAKRSGKHLPEAHWTAGLAHWRLGAMDKAAKHFELAAAYDSAPWTRAASAFWAARSYLVARQPERVMALLEAAAQHPRTFYGMLATRLLGREVAFNWDLPAMDGQDVRLLLNDEGGRRALALLQVGDRVTAERDLRQVAKLASDELARGIFAIAAHAGMADLTMRLDAKLYPNGGGYDGAAYPLPDWKPADGFKIDPALVYALVRQESGFNPKAKSVAGASGLMQLMPGTARFVARHQGQRAVDRKQLFEPGYNLSLGQRYVSILLQDQNINGDLFLMTAAWNGGPGNLSKWRRNIDSMGDSLFFIESLPSQETREFIERVLTNMWIYKDRLGQDSPSLDAIASGAWPSYHAPGRDPELVVDNADN